jgi:hypothetical protein
MAYLLIAAASLHEDKTQGDPQHRSHTTFLARSALVDKKYSSQEYFVS